MNRDGDRAGAERGGLRHEAELTVEEFRRRNVTAVGVDLVYLFTTAFLATLAVRGTWPAVIAALPLAAFLYFAWRSTPAFFTANLAVIALSVAATFAGVLPL